MALRQLESKKERTHNDFGQGISTLQSMEEQLMHDLMSYRTKLKGLIGEE